MVSFRNVDRLVTGDSNDSKFYTCFIKNHFFIRRFIEQPSLPSSVIRYRHLLLGFYWFVSDCQSVV